MQLAAIMVSETIPNMSKSFTKQYHFYNYVSWYMHNKLSHNQVDQKKTDYNVYKPHKFFFLELKYCEKMSDVVNQ